MARAIVEPRELLLVDEPSKGLAPAIIQNPDRGLPAAEGAAHHECCWWSRTSRWAKALGDRVAVMDNGQVVHAGAMAELAGDEALQQRLLWPVAGGASNERAAWTKVLSPAAAWGEAG